MVVLKLFFVDNQPSANYFIKLAHFGTPLVYTSSDKRKNKETQQRI
jgi:hypothetical protein